MKYFVHAQSNESGLHELHAEGCEKVNVSLEPVSIGKFSTLDEAAAAAIKLLYLPLVTCPDCCGKESVVDGTPSAVIESKITSTF